MLCSIFNNLAPTIPFLPNRANNYELISIDLTESKYTNKTTCEQSCTTENRPDEV